MSATLPYQPHSETSRDAAHRAAPRAPTDRMRVLRAIREAGARGLTDKECQALLGLGGSTQRPRRIELADAGLIRRNGEKRDRSDVWVAVGDGEQLELVR